ncbi:hypothetical protein BB560_005839, partial [Smittium megazygosporum]
MSIDSKALDIKPRKEISNYFAPWSIGSFSWAQSISSNPFKFAIGSLVENTNNQIQVVQLSPLNSSDTTSDSDFVLVAEHALTFPTTKILWKPETNGYSEDYQLFATTSDKLRVWKNQNIDSISDIATESTLEILFSLNA